MKVSDGTLWFIAIACIATAIGLEKGAAAGLIAFGVATIISLVVKWILGSE